MASGHQTSGTCCDHERSVAPRGKVPGDSFSRPGVDRGPAMNRLITKIMRNENGGSAGVKEAVFLLQFVRDNDRFKAIASYILLMQLENGPYFLTKALQKAGGDPVKLIRVIEYEAEMAQDCRVAAVRAAMEASVATVYEEISVIASTIRPYAAVRIASLVARMCLDHGFDGGLVASVRSTLCSEGWGLLDKALWSTVGKNEDLKAQSATLTPEQKLVAEVVYTLFSSPYDLIDQLER